MTPERAAAIAARIDWSPTCEPGEEHRAIVGQVIALVGVSDPAPAAETRLAALRAWLDRATGEHLPPGYAAGWAAAIRHVRGLIAEEVGPR